MSADQGKCGLLPWEKPPCDPAEYGRTRAGQRHRGERGATDDRLGGATEHVQRRDRKDNGSHPQHLARTSLLELGAGVALARKHLNKWSTPQAKTTRGKRTVTARWITPSRCGRGGGNMHNTTSEDRHDA